MPNRRNPIYVLLILCLLGGVITGRTFFLNLAYLFGALLIFSFIVAWASVTSVQISRRTNSKRAQVGRVLEESFTVRNAGILPKLWLEVRDHSNVPGHNPSAVTPPLLPRGRFDWTARTVCVVRGEYTLGPLTLISGDPFGLFQTTRQITAVSKILIFPAVLPIHNFVPPTGILSGGDAQRQRAPFVTTNAAGIRDYAPGDSYNRIHWKTSAKRDQLMVKEFELDPIADVWLFLDLSESAVFERPYTTEGITDGEFFIPPSSLEYAIITTASLAEYFLIKERALGFATYNPSRFVISPDQNHRQITRILETLAMARPHHNVSCEQLLAFEGHHMDRGAMAVIVTADPTDGWIREANLLVRRGLRVVAIIFDPASFGETEVRPVEDTQKLLEANGIITYVIAQGDNISAVLSQRIR